MPPLLHSFFISLKKKAENETDNYRLYGLATYGSLCNSPE